VRVFGRALDIYEPNSTVVNGRRYRDVRGRSPLAYGLVMPPIAPGECVTVAYTARPKEEAPEVPEFRIEIDGQDALEVRGPSYTVTLQHTFQPEVDIAEVPLRLDALPDAEPEPVHELVPVPGPVHAPGPLRFEHTPVAPPAQLMAEDTRTEKLAASSELLFAREIGLYRHVFGMRLFAPEGIAGASREVDDAWNAIRSAFADDLRAPLLRLVLPDFMPTLAWAQLLEHENVLPAVETLMREMPDLLAGYFEPDEPPSMHHLNAVLAELIGRSAGGNDALQRYGDALAKNFRALVYMGDAQRHERMLRAPTEELDAAFEAVRTAVGTEVAA
jgi:hypothetical protein